MTNLKLEYVRQKYHPSNAFDNCLGETFPRGSPDFHAYIQYFAKHLFCIRRYTEDCILGQNIQFSAKRRISTSVEVQLLDTAINMSSC